MRKLICVFLSLLLLPLAALAEGIDLSTEQGNLEWVNKKLPYARTPENFDIVPYDELPPVIEGQHHYLLLCLDHWDINPRPDDAKNPSANGKHKDNWGNTDGMVLLTLDTRAHRIMLTSIIRDAVARKIDYPDDNQRFTRMTYVYNDLGPEGLCETISRHIGVKIEKYILFTFNQIASIVDYMGGVEVELDGDEIDYLRRYAVPPGSVKDMNGLDLRSGSLHRPGMYHFNGHSAVLYMRIRKSSGHGDFARTGRVREALSALADKCRLMTMDDAKALANNVLDHSNKTNMSLEEIIQAAEYAYSLRDCTIEEFRIPPDDAVRAIQFAEMDVQEINWAYIRVLMDDYLQNSYLVLDDDDDF